MINNSYEGYLEDLLRQLNITLKGALHDTTVNVVLNHYFGSYPILIHFEILHNGQSHTYTLHIYANKETNTNKYIFALKKQSLLKELNITLLEAVFRTVNIHDYKRNLPTYTSMVLTDCQEKYFTQSHFLMHI